VPTVGNLPNTRSKDENRCPKLACPKGLRGSDRVVPGLGESRLLVAPPPLGYFPAVSSHSITKDLKARLQGCVPFGLLDRKPRHFQDMLKIAWQNRDNLPYAWKVLSRGVCDGCALGVAGFHDWTIEGTHLCMTRLNLLRLNTMPALDISLLQDVRRLRAACAGTPSLPDVARGRCPGFPTD
jgi:hypothetical protein